MWPLLISLCRRQQQVAGQFPCVVSLKGPVLFRSYVGITVSTHDKISGDVGQRKYYTFSFLSLFFSLLLYMFERLFILKQNKTQHSRLSFWDMLKLQVSCLRKCCACNLHLESFCKYQVTLYFFYKIPASYSAWNLVLTGWICLWYSQIISFQNMQTACAVNEAEMCLRKRKGSGSCRTEILSSCMILAQLL